jgi:hypothetical protein
MFCVLRNFFTITTTWPVFALRKLPFGEPFPNFHLGLVDFAASEEEIRVSNESNVKRKFMRSYFPQNVQVQAAVSVASVRLFSLIFILVLLGLVLLIASGGPP